MEKNSKEINDLISFIYALTELKYTPSQIGEAVKAYQNQKSNSSLDTINTLNIEELVWNEIDDYDDWKFLYLYRNQNEISKYLPFKPSEITNIKNDTIEMDRFFSDKDYAKYIIKSILEQICDKKYHEITEYIFPISSKKIPFEILLDIIDEDSPTYYTYSLVNHPSLKTEACEKRS